jgi:ribosome recycling factor
MLGRARPDAAPHRGGAAMADMPIVREAREKMKKGVDFFADSLKGLRTGRPTPALVEHVKVDAYGSPMPLNQVASVSVPDPRTLLIRPFDPSLCTAIEKAILKSDLGITPASDGKAVRLAIPMMSQEQRDKMTHRVKDLAEQARVTLRNIRRDQIKLADAALAASQLTDDQDRQAKDDIQKVLKEMETEIDKVVDTRIREIQSS